MGRPVNPDVGDLTIGPDLQLALEACRRREGPSLRCCEFSVRAIEHMSLFIGLMQPARARDYLAALSEYATAENEPELSVARANVVREREKLLMALGDDGIEGTLQ